MKALSEFGSQELANLSVAAYDAGGAGVAWARFPAGNPTPGDTIDVNGRTYVFGAAGDVSIPIGGSLAITLDNAIAAINTDPSGLIYAFRISAVALMFTARGAGSDTGYSLSESTGGARIIVSDGSFKSNKDQAPKKIVTAAYGFTAADVTAIAAGQWIPVMSYRGPTSLTVGSAVILVGLQQWKPLASTIYFRVTGVEDMFVVSISDSTPPNIAAGDALLMICLT